MRGVGSASPTRRIAGTGDDAPADVVARRAHVFPLADLGPHVAEERFEGADAVGLRDARFELPAGVGQRLAVDAANGAACGHAAHRCDPDSKTVVITIRKRL